MFRVSDRWSQRELSLLAALVIGVVGGGCATQKDSVDAGDLEGDVGIIYGPGHAFAVDAPKGWVLDNQSGVPYGLQAVFYPVGGSFPDGEVMMYVRTLPLPSAKDPIGATMQNDLASLRQEDPSAAAKAAADIRTKDEKTARVSLFFTHKQSEAIAYLVENELLVTFVLVSRTQERVTENLPAFKELVGAYMFITENVEIQKSR
jgi:hypothetical protein